ncbi:hypothetical protein [Mycobacteroides abscessus]|uniref:hypothetical protein n=1 Tax=Mycobacteroides abscessus TaxID=36809 RepID=UPI0019D272A7|nr:hypothetical protein [Mycobacteroides abscessus]MBN7314183.1 hypothetical protein [Mycobacteroides abscessus subsp. abscessus]
MIDRHTSGRLKLSVYVLNAGRDFPTISSVGLARFGGLTFPRGATGLIDIALKRRDVLFVLGCHRVHGIQ